MLLSSLVAGSVEFHLLCTVSFSDFIRNGCRADNNRYKYSSVFCSAGF